MIGSPTSPAGAQAEPTGGDGGGALAVFRIRPFLLLWLSQAATQIGGNMVIYGLTVIIFDATRSNAAVSALLLTFLVPAVALSAVAGVYVDRLDRRLLLVVTNVLRAGAFGLMFLAGSNILLIYVLNIAVSVVTVFFAPAEAAMIPTLVPRNLLLSANGVFTLTLNAAFPLGFALIGPLVVTLAGPQALLLVIAALYLIAAAFCFTLPPAPPEPDPVREAAPHGAFNSVLEAEHAIGTTIAQLREGLGFIRAHRNVGWSLTYLGITASLIGVLGVLGPDFATEALGLGTKDFVVVVLPLGFGVVVGILLLNSYGRLLPRRRVIEAGLISLGGLLGVLSIAGPLSRFLQARAEAAPTGPVDLSGVVSLLSVVIGIAFLVGVAYAVVAIPSQTQLQEDLPEDVRGRVFGVLNMLVSIASLLPIVVVGPISDLIGTPTVIVLVALLVGGSGVASVVSRGSVLPTESAAYAEGGPHSGPVDPVGVALHSEIRFPRDEEADHGAADARSRPPGVEPKPEVRPR